jgi:addiction module RelB/DinJ family antitoxin
MATRAQPEIRFRVDAQERESFEQVGAAIGMSANEMVRVFIKRTIAAGGLPFDMKAPPAYHNRAGERLMPIFGQPPALLAEVAANAARDAEREHIRAGRLPGPDNKKQKRGHATPAR